MQGYIKTIKEFSDQEVDSIIKELINLYPQAESSQIQSWKTLVADIKSAPAFQSTEQCRGSAVFYEGLWSK